MNKPIFITWERHQRTRSLCSKLDITLFEILSPKKGVARYLEIIPKTLSTLKTNKPSVLFVQNPSIILTLLAVFFKFWFNYKLIVDAHNEAVEPFIHNNMIIRTLAKFIIAHADNTIVTNGILAEKVYDCKGNAIVLPDFLPQMEPRAYLPPPTTGIYVITLICTYADDEPYEEIFNAIAAIGDKAQLNVTGKIPAKIDTLKIPTNVKLLGFLSEHDYWETLFNSHIIIDLSTMNNCLVCGAYESLAIQKPLLLSKNNASENLFGQYATHVENTSRSIKAGIETLIENYDSLPNSIIHFKESFVNNEQKNIAHLKTIIARYSNDSITPP